MLRKKYDDLIKWKNNKKKKPLIIKGARQVGKTWLMKKFSNEYDKFIYINFENNIRMEELFSKDFDVQRILLGLELESDVKIDVNNMLIIFDEIQEVPKALTSLKYFYEIMPELDIIAAGSLLGVALHKGTSFPVGKVEFLHLYPLSFSEFLIATGNDKFNKLLMKLDFDMISMFKDKYIALLKQYYFIGGMPEAVLTFKETGDYSLVREVHNRLLLSYEQDFSKHAPNKVVPRIRLVWESIPSQLSKENKKYIYSLIRKGARAKDYELAIQWLVDCGLIHKVDRINKPGIPLEGYRDLKSFKLYFIDVGLLSALSGLNKQVILEGSVIFEEFKGALTEQFVMQEITCESDYKKYYWSAENSRGEIDLLIQFENSVIPIEIKANENLQSKSLRSFNEKFNIAHAVRTSMSNYREEAWLTNIPLYSIYLLEKILS